MMTSARTISITISPHHRIKSRLKTVSHSIDLLSSDPPFFSLFSAYLPINGIVKEMSPTVIFIWSIGR
jgi:hypothetical protein